MWTDEWIGIPYRERGRDREGFDCLGLFVTLQRERHNRVVFDPLCSVSAAVRQQIAQKAKNDWRRVDAAKEGDALLFKVRGLEVHVGYALDHRLMLHTSHNTGESLIEDYTAMRWRSTLEGIYTYAGF